MFNLNDFTSSTTSSTTQQKWGESHPLWSETYKRSATLILPNGTTEKVSQGYLGEKLMRLHGPNTNFDELYIPRKVAEAILEKLNEVTAELEAFKASKPVPVRK